MTASSLHSAVELFHLPSKARHLRSEPLPLDVLRLLQIAAGDEDTLHTACVESEKPKDFIQKAATFFIEQVLLAETEDSYRILGVSPDASSADLHRNFRLLMRWLHPDGQEKDGQSVYAARVSEAWNNVKTVERRAHYDKAQSERAWARTFSPRSFRDHRNLSTHLASARARRIVRPNLWQRFLSSFLLKSSR